MQSYSTFRRLALPMTCLLTLCAFVHACGGGGGGSGGSPAAPAPPPGPTNFVSTFQFPADSSINVPLQPIILLGFNDTVNPATMSSTTVQLLQVATPVNSTLTYLPCNNRIQLMPNAALLPGLPYTISLTAGLQDDDATSLTPVTFTFTTTATPDNVRPQFTAAGFTGAPNGGAETNQVVLDWADATDNLSAANAITYRVYVSTGPLCFDFSDPDFVTPAGSLQAVIGGLQPRTDYSFVVRAVDEGGNESTNTVPVDVTTFTSFSTNVYPIAAPNSLCQSCHLPGGTATQAPYFINMNYQTPATTYNSWVGAASQCPQAAGAGFGTRVVAGDPSTSFLWNKISGEPAGVVCGVQMPFGLPPLSDANQDIIMDWITEGALDN